jgi:hypothetical protein
MAMLTRLIISSSLSQRDTYLAEATAGIHPVDILSTESDVPKGIAFVRSLLQQIAIAPLRSTRRIVILYDAHTLTPEAQQALLKTIEEPPSSTALILTAPYTHPFLPTILSRVQLISLDSTQAPAVLPPDLTTLESASDAQKLAYAEEIAADPQRIRSWYTGLLSQLRQRYRADPDPLLRARIDLVSTAVHACERPVIARAWTERILLML